MRRKNLTAHQDLKSEEIRMSKTISKATKLFLSNNKSNINQIWFSPYEKERKKKKSMNRNTRSLPSSYCPASTTTYIIRSACDTAFFLLLLVLFFSSFDFVSS